MRPYNTSSHVLFELKVHLVWITKYRYHVLTTDIGTRVRDIIRQVCEQMGIEIISGAVSKNHVHLFVSYPPSLSVAEIMKLVKGRTSRKIQQEFPALGNRYWGRHFWGIGYAAFSSGHVTDEMIKEYVDNHITRETTDSKFIVE